MDGYQLIAELVRALVSLAWPLALVATAYIVKLILDNIEIPQLEEKKPDVTPRSPTIPRVQIRPTPGPRPNETPPR